MILIHFINNNNHQSTSWQHQLNASDGHVSLMEIARELVESRADDVVDFNRSRAASPSVLQPTSAGDGHMHKSLSDATLMHHIHEAAMQTPLTGDLVCMPGLAVYLGDVQLQVDERVSAWYRGLSEQRRMAYDARTSAWSVSAAVKAHTSG